MRCRAALETRPGPRTVRTTRRLGTRFPAGPRRGPDTPAGLNSIFPWSRRERGWLEIGQSGLFARPLPKGVVLAFANCELYLVLANYGPTAIELETTAGYVATWPCRPDRYGSSCRTRSRFSVGRPENTVASPLAKIFAGNWATVRATIRPPSRSGGWLSTVGWPPLTIGRARTRSDQCFAALIPDPECERQVCRWSDESQAPKGPESIARGCARCDTQLGTGKATDNHARLRAFPRQRYQAWHFMPGSGIAISRIGPFTALLMRWALARWIATDRSPVNGAGQGTAYISLINPA